MKIKVGDAVRLSLTGRREYLPAEDNPHGLSGLVILYREPRGAWAEFNWKVEWSNGSTNWYREVDLDMLATPLVSEVVDPVATTLPTDSTARKEYPLYSGPLKYFPSALAGVAKVCKVGNDKHRPGLPLGHSRGKSGDHEDCIIRHLVDLSEDRGHGVGRDENGIAQVDYIAWRALALAQEWHEKHDGAPIAPGAFFD